MNLHITLFGFENIKLLHIMKCKSTNMLKWNLTNGINLIYKVSCGLPECAWKPDFQSIHVWATLTEQLKQPPGLTNTADNRVEQ